MLPFFNQKRVGGLLKSITIPKIHISFRKSRESDIETKVRDLSSPSLFSMGTRERTGTTFQKVNYQMLYTIYVRKADYERAVHVITV